MTVFKSKTFVVVCVLPVLLFFSGCLSATHPLAHRERIKKDSPLIGYWHGVISNSSQNGQLQIWSVFHFGGNHLSVVMSNKKAYPKDDFDLVRTDEDNSLFDAYISKIGDDTYLSLRAIRGTDIRDYIIVKYEIDGDKLIVFNINDAAIKRAVESNQLRARRDGGSYTITSRSSDMNKWIETLTPFDFEPYGTFEYSELDPRELTHHLLSTIPTQN